MNLEIKREAKSKGITRLCHFSPSRNLIHIVTGSVGILATKNLRADERNIYTPTDIQRLDGYERHISCSIEFPNAWYFQKAREKEVLFTDWVILLIDPAYLWRKGTLFCPRNAASGYGRQVSEGFGGFSGMYADQVPGAYGKVYVRTEERLPCCPTDEQAEVLIPDRIVLRDIIGVVVHDEAQAKREILRFRLAQVAEDSFKFVLAPDLFEKHVLSAMIKTGRRPVEKAWVPGNSDE